MWNPVLSVTGLGVPFVLVVLVAGVVDELVFSGLFSVTVEFDVVVQTFRVVSVAVRTGGTSDS